MLEMGLNLAVLRPYRLQMQLVWAFLVVAPAPFCVCFAVSPAGETQIWPGDLRVLAAVFGFCFIFDLPRDCGTKVFHNVLICLPASRAKSAATEGKKSRLFFKWGENQLLSLNARPNSMQSNRYHCQWQLSHHRVGQ